MGALKKMINKVRSATRPGGPNDMGSRGVTGIAPGDRGSNTGQGRDRAGDRRIPGRRNPMTPLGPGRQQM